MKINSILSRIGFHAVYEKTLEKQWILLTSIAFLQYIWKPLCKFFPEKHTVEARREIARYAATET